MITLSKNGVVKAIRQAYSRVVTTIKTKIGALKMHNVKIQQPANNVGKSRLRYVGRPAPKKQTIEQVLDENNVIIGAVLFLAVISIAFSSYIVWVSTDGLLPKVLLLPQLFLAALICAWKFTKK